MKTKRVLLSCFEFPGYGGASTAGYHLFQRMQDDGWDVHYLNIINNGDVGNFTQMFGEDYGNPLNLKYVYTLELQGELFDLHPELRDFVEKLKPDIIVGLGYIPSFLFKEAKPEIPLLFLTAGLSQMQFCIEHKRTPDAITFLKNAGRSLDRQEIYHRREKLAMQNADLVITHSEIMRQLALHFFPTLNGQIYPEVLSWVEWIYSPVLAHQNYKKPWPERDIDLLFISSNWSRVLKNYILLKKITAEFSGLNIHVVGEIEPKQKLQGVTFHHLITNREELFELMGRCKIVVSTSLFDAAPGILFEASAMGCNVVASKNCGNWQLCHEKLVADPSNLSGFKAAISYSLEKKFDDNISLFLNTEPYHKLMEIITAF